ncbi:hypothetical protein AOC36_00380 [Erysipelothrix larvae]|uniref:Helicase n=1 Tax=Erysipelothrix larvae TaxID=1514105 RepID=A0A109UGF9_9FIRM|nr:helicase-related protein [Erysipelothrix larvae]AMC92503.1 hypothetical protein AOC36_00380 [Erysipelothrix larvae]
MCPFCFASEPYYFHHGICRRCLPYRGASLEEKDQLCVLTQADLSIELTQAQIESAHQIIDHCFSTHVCVEAVCGAGKTEMCVPLIEHCLSRGLKIGWATPRKQIVIELSERLQTYFKDSKIVAVYGSNTEIVEGDLVVCTTHQIFRYHHYFDVLILDEPDAFPFKGNQLLQDLLRASLKGYCVFLSATFDNHQFINFGPIHKIYVNQRPSMEPLSVPIVTMSLWRMILELWFLRSEKVLLFVPTIQTATLFSKILQCRCITSKNEHAAQEIEQFRREQSGILVTTTVLERGVTFKDCFVVVYDAGHVVFDEASLTQISGRVRRGMNPKKGHCMFYVKERSKVVDACINRIQKANGAGYASQG